MEKFDLKWNDFQKTISQYFKALRDEKDFFDVTLVTDDLQQFETHKIVLSACSNFFKPILKANVHAHPLIYLSGVDSSNLQLILNYIYEGEVQLYQEQLDLFLDVAQKLQISGLLGGKADDVINEEPHQFDQHSKFKEETNSLVNSENERYFVENKSKVNPVSVIGHNPEEVNQKINELLVKELDLYRCTVCGKLSKDSSNMRRHVEVHIDGLSYQCNLCDKTFRSGDSFRKHSKYRCSKS